MLLRLITPANEDSAYIRSLAVGILAAQTPPHIRVEHTDDLLDPIRLDHLPDADLVGLSVFSKTARRAYEIADAYRAQRVPVILGGIHPTALPDEASQHAEAVVVGEAEGQWPLVLRDALSGTLQRFYRQDNRPALQGHPPPRRDRALFPSRRYVPIQVVQTRRGCPFRCEFCSVNVQSGSALRVRPIREVVSELESLGSRLLFADDNILVPPAFSRQLLEAMIPLRKEWVGQASLSGLERPSDVRLLQRSGCKALFIGFETVSEAALRGTGKTQNRPARYLDAVARLHDAGIAIWGSFVFGFDDDDESVFEQTVAFARKARLTMALFALLTPYPGTPLYNRLKTEGRLTAERWWLEREHDELSPYFIPRRLSREALREGWVQAWKEFYSLRSIVARWRPGLTSGWLETLGHLPLNGFMHRLASRKIAGGRRRFLSG